MTGQTIAGYEILEKLGEGGMGVVYKARDTRLDRFVALKFLPPDLVTTASRIQRFEAEARSVSTLNHPNISTIHSMHEDAGRRFFVLEFLPGGTLRSRLDEYRARRQPFPIAEAVRVCAAVADGLAHAHRNSVIHRDLKPENIMFTEDGVPRITDFGLAKSPRGANVTTDGITLGTVPYLAPEQALRAQTTPLGDLFALGVVMFELIAGERPFSGATDFATMQAIVNDSPPPLRRVRPDVPVELDRIVAKLLEKDPERRFQSAAEVAMALHALPVDASPKSSGAGLNPTRTLTRLAIPTRGLRRHWRRSPAVFITAGLAAVAAAGGIWYERVQSETPPLHLAVLPFTGASGSVNDAAFGSGLADVVAGKLSLLGPGVSVIPESELRRAGITKASDARRVFHVRKVLTGEIHTGEQTRVDLHLVDAGSGKIIGSVSVTSAGPDLNQALAREASALIGLPIDPLDAARLRVENAKSATAYDHYTLGERYLLRYDKPGYIDRAIAEFQQATRRDPTYARGYAGLASAWWREFQYANNRRAIDLAREAASQALSRNENLAQPHVVLGAIAVHAGQIDDGIRELKKALELEPVSADACRELGIAYFAAGKPADAEAKYKDAIRYSPDFWLGYNDLGSFYYRQARYREARDAFATAAELAPDNYIVFRNLGGVEEAIGDMAGAERDFLRAIKLRPWGSVYSGLGSLYILNGRYADAIPVLKQAASSAGSDRNAFAIWCNLGDAYEFAGGHRNGTSDDALAAWKKAIAIGRDRLALSPDDFIQRAEVAVYEAKAGDMAAARSDIAAARAAAPKAAARDAAPKAAAQRAAPRDGGVLFFAALVAELDHRRPDALALLRTALANGYSVSFVEKEPELKNLRSDPAYLRMVARLKSSFKEHQ